MPESLAAAVVTAAGLYLACGLLFAGPFVLFGVQRVDAVARQATPGFRLVIVPGVLVFWPLLAIRWARRSSRPPQEVNAHRRRAMRRAA